MADTGPESTARPGRRKSTSHDELERVAFALFGRYGFEATTVDDIARAAGIGRRTFFRYFDSKNDVVWGSFDAHLGRMRERLRARPAGEPLTEAIRTAVVEFNRVDPDEQPRHRARLELILRVPALQAHSTLRYADWRAVVAEFAAERLGVAATSLLPRTLAHATLGIALAAYEQWLTAETATADLTTLLDEALTALTTGFDHLT